MSPVNRRALTVAVVIAIVLFFAPLVLRMQADAGGIADPCALLWTPQTGIVEMCSKLYLSTLEVSR